MSSRRRTSTMVQAGSRPLPSCSHQVRAPDGRREDIWRGVRRHRRLESMLLMPRRPARSCTVRLPQMFADSGSWSAFAGHEQPGNSRLVVISRSFWRSVSEDVHFWRQCRMVPPSTKPMARRVCHPSDRSKRRSPKPREQTIALPPPCRASVPAGESDQPAGRQCFVEHRQHPPFESVLGKRQGARRGCGPCVTS